MIEKFEILEVDLAYARVCDPKERESNIWFRDVAGYPIVKFFQYLVIKRILSRLLHQVK